MDAVAAPAGATMPGYDFGAIEPKWQKYWDENKTFVQPNPGAPGFVDKQVPRLAKG